MKGLESLVQNEFASRYSTQSYIYTRHVFFAHLPLQTHDPTQPTKNKFRPIADPTQPNPWVNPTHGQLCVRCHTEMFFVNKYRLTLPYIPWNPGQGSIKTFKVVPFDTLAMVSYFEKACDKVPHRLLLQKLRLYTLNKNVINWFVFSMLQKTELNWMVSIQTGLKYLLMMLNCTSTLLLKMTTFLFRWD